MAFDSCSRWRSWRRPPTGASPSGPGSFQWVLGVGSPLAVAVVWGRFIAPKASHPTTDPLRLLLEVTVFAAGVAALLAADRIVLAVVFAALVLIHLSLTFVLDQRPR